MKCTLYVFVTYDADVRDGKLKKERSRFKNPLVTYIPVYNIMFVVQFFTSNGEYIFRLIHVCISYVTIILLWMFRKFFRWGCVRSRLYSTIYFFLKNSITILCFKSASLNHFHIHPSCNLFYMFNNHIFWYIAQVEVR